MVPFNDVLCQICDRFYTKEQWNKRLYSSRHLHREVNGFWPAIFPQRKLTRDECLKLEKGSWEVIFTSNENDLALFDFLKIYFRMCTNINNYIPIRYCDDDPGEEKQWGYGYRDDMISQFKQNLYNKNFTFQDQGKCDPIDTLENRIKVWVKINNKDEASIPDNLYDYVYNDEGLDYSVRGAEIFPESSDFKKSLDIVTCK